jgi:hypothetical protein
MYGLRSGELPIQWVSVATLERPCRFDIGKYIVLWIGGNLPVAQCHERRIPVVKVHRGNKLAHEVAVGRKEIPERSTGTDREMSVHVAGTGFQTQFTRNGRG